MDIDDTDVLKQLPSGDSPSDSLRMATHITGTFKKPDFAHMEGAVHSDLQNDDDVNTATFNSTKTKPCLSAGLVLLELEVT